MADDKKIEPAVSTKSEEAAYEQAASASTAAAPAPKAAPKAAAAPAAPKTEAPAPAKAEPVKAPVEAAAKKAPAAATKTVAKPAPVKAAAKPAKTPAKPAPKAVKPKTKTTAKKTATPKVAAAKKPAAPRKETIVTKTAEEAKKAGETIMNRVQDMMGDLNERAKTAFEKGRELAADANEFNKANLEAIVESGKIAAKGVQDLGAVYAEDTRKNFEEATATMKQFASVKSPTEFFQLQTETARKSFDAMVAQTSKHSEAMIKLVGEVAQPISNRVSVAMERVKTAA